MRNPNEEQIKFINTTITASKGTAGLRTQVGGCATTITAAAEATGGLCKGTLFTKRTKTNNQSKKTLLWQTKKSML